MCKRKEYSCFDPELRIIYHTHNWSSISTPSNVGWLIRFRHSAAFKILPLSYCTYVPVFNTSRRVVFPTPLSPMITSFLERILPSDMMKWYWHQYLLLFLHWLWVNPAQSYQLIISLISWQLLLWWWWRCFNMLLSYDDDGAVVFGSRVSGLVCCIAGDIEGEICKNSFRPITFDWNVLRT